MAHEKVLLAQHALLPLDSLNPKHNKILYEREGGGGGLAPAGQLLERMMMSDYLF